MREGLGVGVLAEDLALEGRQPRGEEVGDLGPLGATQAPTGGRAPLGLVETAGGIVPDLET